MTNRLARRKSERRGRLAEWLCAALLLLKGYWPLAHRVRTPVGEIDLLVRRGRMVVFIEVKQRRNLSDALEAVTFHQRQRIIDAARWWLARNPEFVDCDIRFDVMAIGAGGLPRHIHNAFQA